MNPTCRALVLYSFALLALGLGCASTASPAFREYEAAIHARDQGNYELAEWEFSRGLDKSPHDVHCWNGRAEMRLARQRYAGAVDDATRAIELDQQYGAAYHTRSRARSRGASFLTPRAELATFDLDGAIQDMSKALELGVPSALLERARLRAIQRDFPLALNDVAAAIAQNPTDPDPVALRCVIHVLQGEEDAAAADRAKVIELNPSREKGLDTLLDQLRAARL